MLSLKQQKIDGRKGKIYCDDIGKIERYDAKENFGCGGLGELVLYADNIEFHTMTRIIVARGSGLISLTCYRDDNLDSVFFRKAFDQYKKLGETATDLIHFDLIDPRVIRAYILMYYEYAKDKDIKRTTNVLNKDTSITFEEAYEWLEINRFPVLREYELIYGTDNKELVDYIYDFNKLVKR